MLVMLPLHVSVHISDHLQSTAHEPPEDGRKYGPKHEGQHH